MLGGTQAFSSFSVDDTGRARTFYEDVLGLDVREEAMEGIITIRLSPGGAVMVYPKGDAHVPAGFTVLNFLASDLPATVDALAAKGVTFVRYPDLGEVDDRGIHRVGEGAPDIAWFTDPAGNVMAVMADPGIAFAG
jgi:predicted enzyme related to lactoylglutathione lyase